ncbi:YuzD family protein [Bacillus xiapuensis]|uniref:YuzD family protein n=1 Tax=Bacillus xiapuensis TaxID=2014075 RepID=UPI000C242766|nr:YuzD family protein [Bacillus xiapuensis]
MNKQVEIIVYGTEQLCPSCVNLPSSKETYEWLEAAISRKFPKQPFLISYVDIFAPPEDEEKKSFAKRVIEEELFYPVVLLEGRIVGEGNPKLKVIYREMEKYGYRAELIPEE